MNKQANDLVEHLKIHVRHESLGDVNWLMVRRLIDDAMVQARREVWEEVAKHADSYGKYETMSWCRAKAFMEKSHG